VFQVQVAACERLHFAPKTLDNRYRSLQTRDVSCPGVTVQRYADEADVKMLSLFLNILCSHLLVRNNAAGGVERGEKHHA
jgi:hypothetical protein